MAVAENHKELLNKPEVLPPKIIVYPNFENVVDESVTLSNPTSSTITFKLKGTSPRKIRLSPGYGYIPPNGKTTISVKITRKTDKAEIKEIDLTIVLLAVVATSRAKLRDRNDFYEIYKAATLPRWAIADATTTAIGETACIGAIGYGLYLLMSNGWTSSGVPFSLAACGATLACQTGFLYAAGTSKEPKYWISASASVLGTSMVTRRAFAGVNPTVAWFTIPLILWAAYETSETVAMYLIGKKKMSANCPINDIITCRPKLTS